jgi:hypothetical protein
MVKIFVLVLMLFSLAFSNETGEDKLLIDKIKTFINKDVYNKNRAYINIIFSPKSDYIIGERVNTVKVIETLKENGLLILFFKKPRELKLSFTTSGSPLFFVKIMGDTLRNIGYYQYVTQESNLNNSEFTWQITLNSEYATDPIILQRELKKSGCSIVDVQRNSPTDWSYSIDMSSGYLNAEQLLQGQEVDLKRSLYAHWLDVSQITKLKIYSSVRNDWYPFIVYFDSSLHLLKVIKRDRRTRRINLNIPSNAMYMKISDLYTLKNIRDSLVLNPKGSR